MRTYESVAMLASIIQSVCIENYWVAQQYIEQCKKGSWKKENTEKALKCWNLEHMIDAEQQGKDTPAELRLEYLLNEEAGRENQLVADCRSQWGVPENGRLRHRRTGGDDATGGGDAGGQGWRHWRTRGGA